MSVQQKAEQNVAVLILLTVLLVSVGGIIQIVPLFFQQSTTEPVAGLTPYSGLEQTGRDVYVREGCYNCHSQMIRPFRSETERYGHYSVAGEFVYDRPFQWGSKRTGPDLARVGGRYSDEWHRAHLMRPSDLVPETIMPAYPWLAENDIDPEIVKAKLTALRTLGHPYTDEEIEQSAELVKDKTEMDAMIAYLQRLGTTIKTRR